MKHISIISVVFCFSCLNSLVYASYLNGRFCNEVHATSDGSTTIQTVLTFKASSFTISTLTGNGVNTPVILNKSAGVKGSGYSYDVIPGSSGQDKWGKTRYTLGGPSIFNSGLYDSIQNKDGTERQMIILPKLDLSLSPIAFKPENCVLQDTSVPSTSSQTDSHKSR